MNSLRGLFVTRYKGQILYNASRIRNNLHNFLDVSSEIRDIEKLTHVDKSCV